MKLIGGGLSLMSGFLACEGGEPRVIAPDLLPPAIVQVLPTDPLGAVGSEVTFSVQWSAGEPDRWAWQFDAGVSPQSSTDESPRVQLMMPGDRTGSVVICNAAGCTAPFGFTFQIANEQAPLTWEVFPTGVANIEQPAFGVAGDSIWVASMERTAVGVLRQIRLSRSRSLAPTQETDWDSWDVAPIRAGDEVESLKFHANPNGLYLAWMTSRLFIDPTPLQVAVAPLPLLGEAPDWQTSEFADARRTSVFAFVADAPVLVARRTGGEDRNWLLQATKSLPATAADWTRGYVPGFSERLLRTSDRLVMLHPDLLGAEGIIAISTTGHPQEVTDWRFHDLPLTGSVGELLALEGCVVNERLHVLGDGALFRAQVPIPAGPHDWLRIDGVWDSENVSWIRALEFQGRFLGAVDSYLGGPDMLIVRALTDSPASLTDLEVQHLGTVRTAMGFFSTGEHLVLPLIEDFQVRRLSLMVVSPP